MDTSSNNNGSLNLSPAYSETPAIVANAQAPESLDEVTQLKQKLAQYQQQDFQLKQYMQAPSHMPPEEFEEQIAQRASDIVTKQQSAQQLINEYGQKHPDLVPFQDAIVNEAMAALMDANHQGQKMDDRAAIEAGIERFQSKLKGYIEKFNQLQTQDNYRKRLMKMDVGYGGHPTLPSMGQALNVIGDDDAAFAQYRQLYLKNKSNY